MTHTPPLHAVTAYRDQGYAVYPLRDLKKLAPDKLDRQGNPFHAPLRGKGYQHFGYEWSSLTYDTFDARVDALIRAFGCNLNVLELGCASGHRAADFAAAAHAVTAVDIMDNHAAIARRNRELRATRFTRLPGITFMRADIRKMKASAFHGAAFDVVHASRVVHFIDQKALGPFFAMLAGVLRPRGFAGVNFISHARGEWDDGVSLYALRAVPTVENENGLFNHHFSVVHSLAAQNGLRVDEVYKGHRRGNTAVILRPATAPRPPCP